MTLDPGLAARLLAGIRTHTAQRTGCPEWDTPGIAKALIATEGPPGAVLAAAALAAEDATLRAPSAAAFKAHWPTKASAPPRVSNNIPCPEHTGQTMPCPKCRDTVRPPTPDELAEIREAYQAKVRELREERAEIEQRRAGA